MPSKTGEPGADALVEARNAIRSDYLPSDAEPFMNERQQDYFRGLLHAWKKSIL